MKNEIEIIEAMNKECNFVERILLKIFTKTFIKVYNISRVNCFNSIYKK